MNGISLNDYARQKNISYEAVRKQVVRYANELEGHVFNEGRQRFLDEEAVAFLDAKRQKNPAAVVVPAQDEDKNREIRSLRNEKEALLNRLARVQDELLREKNKIQSLLDEHKCEIMLLEAEKEAIRDKLFVCEKNAQKTSQALLDAQKQFEDEKHWMQQEIEHLRCRKWWHLLFKK